MERFTIQATIPRKSDAAGIEPVQVARSRQDAGPGAEHKDEEYRAIFEKLSLPAVETRSAAESAMNAETALGVPISIPDIEIPALSQIERTDTIKGKFTYKGSIAPSPDAPSGSNFGETLSFNSKLTGITITPKPSNAALCQRVFRLSTKLSDGGAMKPSMRAVDSDMFFS